MKKTLLTSIALISFAISMDAAFADHKKGGSNNNNNSEESRNVPVPVPLDSPSKATKTPPENSWDWIVSSEQVVDNIKSISLNSKKQKIMWLLNLLEINAVFTFKSAKLSEIVTKQQNRLFDIIKERKTETQRKYEAAIKCLENNQYSPIGNYTVESDVKKLDSYALGKYKRWHSVKLLLEILYKNPDNKKGSVEIFSTLKDYFMGAFASDLTDPEVMKCIKDISAVSEKRTRGIYHANSIDKKLTEHIEVLSKKSDLLEWARQHEDKWHKRLSKEALEKMFEDELK